MSLPSNAHQRANLRIVPGSGENLDKAPAATDDQIIDAFEQGDPRFGALLYARVVGAVDGTLYRLLGRYEPEHDDLAQLAFEQIVLSLSRRKFARACSLRSWAGAVTTNVALAHLRRRKVERRLFDRAQPSDTIAAGLPTAGSPERDVVSKRELRRLRQVLSRMSIKLAEAVVMHDALGYEVPEIAALRGISITAAQSRLTRGRKALLQLIEEAAPEEES